MATTRPECFAIAKMRDASGDRSATGGCRKTCFRWYRADVVNSAWLAWGVAITTPSTLENLKASAGSWLQADMFMSRAPASAASGFRSITRVTANAGLFCRALLTKRPIVPYPMIATRKVGVLLTWLIGSSLSCLRSAQLNEHT